MYSLSKSLWVKRSAKFINVNNVEAFIICISSTRMHYNYINKKNTNQNNKNTTKLQYKFTTQS